MQEGFILNAEPDIIVCHFPTIADYKGMHMHRNSPT